ncbi:MAG TPA: DUF2071 domain-containing protein [Hymenobacter sp.]|nr:DUF2071 domain-containing protein [Hymenobacter sp.]
MKKTFLTGEWRNLLMVNYEIDPRILQPYLPAKVELDSWNGTHFVSLIGFRFMHTKVKGIAFPFHRHFEEVNLRFYVRYKAGREWRRGVVFIKEIVPHGMVAVALIANTLYNERYTTHFMRHAWRTPTPDTLEVDYQWKVQGEWNFLRARAEQAACPIPEGSLAEFITEHYWGYTKASATVTTEYEVAHPRWQTHQVLEHEVRCNTRALYGDAFVEPLSGSPASVFLAAGSPISIYIDGRI